MLLGARKQSFAASLSSASKTIHEVLQARALQSSSARRMSSEGTSATQIFERRPLTDPSHRDVHAESGSDRSRSHTIDPVVLTVANPDSSWFADHEDGLNSTARFGRIATSGSYSCILRARTQWRFARRRTVGHTGMNSRPGFSESTPNRTHSVVE